VPVSYLFYNKNKGGVSFLHFFLAQNPRFLYRIVEIQCKKQMGGIRDC